MLENQINHDPSEALKAAFRRHASGVAIITTKSESGEPVGFTATSMTSLGSNPAMVTFNVARGSSSWPALSKASHLALHMLGASNIELAKKMAEDHTKRFLDADWEFSEFGLINRALSHTVYKSSLLKGNPFEIEGFIGLDTLNRFQILMTQDCLIVQDNLTWWRQSSHQASKKISKSLRNEMYLMSKKLFSNELCPLTDDKKLVYIKNTKVKISRIVLKYLIRLKIKKAIKTLIVNDLNISDLRFIFCKINYTNPIFTIDESTRYSLK